METAEKIELLQRHLSFLNTVLAGFLQTGNIPEIENTRTQISNSQSELDELLKQQEDANRESELPVE